MQAVGSSQAISRAPHRIAYHERPRTNQIAVSKPPISAAACAITAASGSNSVCPLLQSASVLIADSGLLPDTGPQSLHDPLGSPGIEAAGKVAITAGGVTASLPGVGLTLPWNGGSSGWPDAVHRS